MAGVIAGISPLPVIGVPIKSPALNGLDSLLSIVQMPGGVPVATVAIDGAKNAGILAAEMLGIKHKEIRQKIREYKSNLKQAVIQKGSRLEKVGYQDY